MVALCNQMKSASRKINELSDNLCMKLYVSQTPIQTKALLIKQSSNTLTFYVPQVNAEVPLKLSTLEAFQKQVEGPKPKSKKPDQEYYLLPQKYLFSVLEEGQKSTVTLEFKKYEEYDIKISSTDDFPKAFRIGLISEKTVFM